jgi:hypothetical protein
MSNSNLSTYLRHDIKTTTNLEQCLSKVSAIVRCVHLGEAKQRVLDGPLPRKKVLQMVDLPPAFGLRSEIVIPFSDKALEFAALDSRVARRNKSGKHTFICRFTKLY